MSSSIGEGNNQDCELNLAPIIDCFTVLITYLLVTASFISLSSLDVGVSASGTASETTPSGPPPFYLTLQIKLSNELTLKIGGGTLTKEVEISVPAQANGAYDMDMLRRRFEQIQKKYPSLEEVSIGAEPTIPYKELVHVINDVRKSIPKIFISSS
jgi:biopolymer transport protein ExbD